MFQTGAHSFFNCRMFAMFMLGFASGLPLLLTSSTLQAWFTVSGVSIKQIGLLTLVGVPYTFKFCWAPILDKYTPLWLGRRRSWMFVTQCAIVIALLIVGRFSPAHHGGVIAVVMLVIAFLSASQDIAINAYQTDILQEYERGMGASLSAFGYRLAMVVSGSFALIIADYWGWLDMFDVMAAVMLGMMVYTWFSPALDEAPPPPSLQASFVEPFKEFFARDGAWLILVAVVLYRFGDNIVLALNTTFLLKTGFSLTAVGAASKTVGFAAAMLGMLLGGYLLRRLTIFQGVFWFGVIQMVACSFYIVLAAVGKNYSIMMLTVAAEYLGVGMCTSALIAWTMSLCDHRYTATQFALITALAGTARVFVGPLSGYLQVNVGWVWYYIIGTAAAVPGLIVLWLIRDKFMQKTPAQSGVA